MLIDRFIKHIDLVPNYIMEIGSRDLEQAIEFQKVYNRPVVSFEPNPSQFNICVNKLIKDIQIYPYALSSTTGKIDFYVTEDNVGASSTLEPIDVPFAANKNFTTIKVTAYKGIDFLRAYNLDPPDIIWMDVQGAELSALKGFEDALQLIKFIHCEGSIKPYYKGHELQDTLIKYLESKGFKLIDSYGHDNHPYQEGDLIFKNEGRDNI